MKINVTVLPLLLSKWIKEARMKRIFKGLMPLPLLVSVFVCTLLGQWKRTSGPCGGEVCKIIIDPQNEETLYAITMTAFSGVFKSTDGGKTWVALTNGLGFNDIDSYARMPEDLAIDVSMPDTLYVAVNQPGSVGPSCLYRTTNGGDNWAPVKTTKIYALCAKDGTVFALSDSGLLCSSNAGETWKTQNPSLSGNKILLDEQNILWIGGSEGLFSSSDSAKTYRQFVFQNFWKVDAFDVSSANGEKCVAVSVAGNPAKYDSLYISFDEGTTWVNRTQTLPYEPSIESYEIPYALRISRHNTNRIFAGSAKGFYRTTDRGMRWEKQDSGLTLPHVTFPNYQTIVTSLEISRDDTNTILAGTTNDGIYRSTDEGATWQFLSMPSGEVGALSVGTLDNPDRVYCASTGGLYYQTDSMWVPTSMLVGQIESWGGIMALAVSPHNPDLVLVSPQNSVAWGLLYKTTDGGTTWSLEGGTPSEGRFTRILFDPIDSTRVYAGWIASYGPRHGGILMSINESDSWTQLQNGFEPVDIAIDPTDNQRFYVLDQGGAIYLSTDKGITWNTLRAESDSEHSVLRFDPTNPRRLFVGSFNLFVSEDRGDTWVRKSFGKKITDIDVDGETGDLFVATYKDGVWCSTNGGDTFVKISSLPSERITKLLFYIKDRRRRLMAGTRAVGAYEYDLGPVLSIQKEKSFGTTFSLSQNYPNPFNPTTTIEYSLPRQSHVNLRIYDVLGREIKTLVNEEQFAGRYALRWNGTSDLKTAVSSGTYFCVFCAGEYRVVKKMMFLR